MVTRNRTGTIRVPLSLDLTTNRVLEELAWIGVFGKNRAEVAAGILGQWIWDNQEKLGRQGIVLAEKSKNKRRKAEQKK